MDKTEQYNDIINMPHHQSATRPRMSNYDRAAQFSPFAALKGYDDKIDEAARVVDEKIELDESSIREINEKLNILQKKIIDKPTIKLTYFKADEKKNGGAYITIETKLKKIDEFEKKLIMVSGDIIDFKNILELRIES